MCYKERKRQVFPVLTLCTPVGYTKPKQLVTCSAITKQKLVLTGAVCTSEPSGAPAAPGLLLKVQNSTLETTSIFPMNAAGLILNPP